MRIKFDLHVILFTITVAVAAAIAKPARADVTIVTETITDSEVSGASRDSLSELGDLAKPVLITVSYSKGKLSRYDTQDRIILRGIKDGAIDILNPADHTYYITTESQEYDRTSSGSSLMSIAGGQGELKLKPEITPLDETRQFQGVTSYGVRFAFRVDYKFPKDAVQVPDMFYASMSGEYWSSTDVPKSPSEITSPNSLSTLPPEILTALKSLDSKYKGPLLSAIWTLVLEAAYKDRHIKLEIVKRQNVCSISRELLADDLFQVPRDYRLVAAPAKITTPDVKPQTNDPAPAATTP